jgi:hypothetical protein
MLIVKESFINLFCVYCYHTTLIFLIWGRFISSTYLSSAFTPVAPQSVRTQSSCQYLFTLLGSTRVKAVCRTLMKLSADHSKETATNMKTKMKCKAKPSLTISEINDVPLPTTQI